MSTIHRTRLVHAILLALVASTCAQAQQAPATPDSQSSTLETIIVTAEKRSEDIQNVPISIGVVDEAQLENLHATQLSDIAPYIPGFTVINGGSPGQAMLGIRGISPLSAGSTVATYIDETPLGTSSNYGAGSTDVLDLLPYDFQSVEVLRGPQGTLYGASALGGVLRYVSKPPDLDTPSWRAGADVFSESNGSDLGYGERLGFSAPIVPGQLAISASIARQNSPGYTDNVRTGEKDEDDFWQQAAHATLFWKANDDFSVRFSAIQSRVDSSSASATALDPVSLKPVYGDLKDDNYVPEPYRKDIDYYNATVNWNLGWADFVSSTNYEDATAHSQLDATLVYGVAFPLFGLPAPGISAVTYDLQLYKTTQEFRLVSKPDDHIEWLLGAFYTNEDSKQNQAASALTLDYVPIAGLDPLAVVGLPSTYKEYAGFGDFTYKFTPMFDITAGARWAHNKQTFSEITSGALEGLGNTSGNSSEDVFTYSLSPRVHINSDSMLYARVASGYQPGGPNLALPGVPTSVEASTLTNYEVGLKTLLDEHRLSLDVSVFDIEWDKIQVSANNGVVAYLANGGTARSRGVEFSSMYMPVPGFRLGFNGAYTDAVLTEDVPSIGGLDGDRLPSIPKWAASATADYSFPLRGGWEGRVGGGIRYVGDSTSALAHSPTALPQDSYTAIDLNGDVSDDHWTFRIFIKNLTDKRVYTNLSALTNAGTGEIDGVKGVPLQPRTVGVGFDVKF
ncbi:MAG TPA: TonB-dependent receptor [Rudaea sp.]|nr:TonB-dependent receptor [Rudaea sp.]